MNIFYKLFALIIFAFPSIDFAMSSNSLSVQAKVAAAETATSPARHALKAGELFTSPPNFWHWKAACDKNIPHFKDSGCSPDKQVNFSHKAATYREFMQAVRVFLAYQEKEFITHSWVDNQKVTDTKTMHPVIQALTVKPETEIIMFGDRHGDVRSTLQMMALLANKKYLDAQNPFKITNPNVLVLGLGDYVDRGNSGVETIQTLLWFKQQNPEQVLLVRGNHEDCSYNVNKTQFQEEMKAKFGTSLKEEDIALVNEIYNYMPVAVFVASGADKKKDVFVGCHGFIELGYHPEKLLQLLATLPEKTSCYEVMHDSKRAQYLQKLNGQARAALQKLAQEKPIFAQELNNITFGDHSGTKLPVNVSWLWSYVIFDKGETVVNFNPGNGAWQWGKELTEAVLALWNNSDSYTIRWIFRGHQHSHNHEYVNFPQSMDKLWSNNGVYKAWHDAHPHSLQEPGAFTLMTAPDNNYAGFVDQAQYPGTNYDTWVILTTGKTTQEWDMKIVNKAMFALPEKEIVVDGKRIVPQLPFEE